MSAIRHPRALRRGGAALAIVGLLTTVGSCISDRTTPIVSTDGCVTPPAAAGLPVVFIKQFTFVPAQLQVHAGESVAWVNCEPDGTPHTATADDASFTSGLLHTPDAYVRQFSSAGTVRYHCDVHPAMKAAVIVD